MANVRTSQTSAVHSALEVDSYLNSIEKAQNSDIQSLPFMTQSSELPVSYPANIRKEELFTALSPAEVQRCERRNSDLAVVLDILEQTLSTPTLRKSPAFETGSYAARIG